MNDHTERRKELFAHFEQCVKAQFSFLNEMYKRVDNDSIGQCVTYASNGVEVSIYYERVSFEIYLTILKSRSLYGKIYIDEILPDNVIRKFCFATDEKTLENAVKELKTFLVEYGNPFINGDISAFEHIMRRRKKQSDKYNLEVVEKRAVEAWRSRHYAEVIALYRSIEKELTPIQKKRLSLCEKRVNG